MSSEKVIQVTHLSKCYHIYQHPRDRLLQLLMGRYKTFYREFWALKNVSFSIYRGQTVGIIGRNGAGKSTLLQLICGTLQPTSGTIAVHGRLAALLELGAGFNPEFTGRENLEMNASLLGLTSAEIAKKAPDIISFSDIGDFIDQPVKTYSSGMFVRLAFAVIAHVNADILVIDEALAVGDVFFQQKCMRFLRDFKDNGGTILLVSHDMGSVMSLCESAILLSTLTEPSAVMDAAETLCKRYLEQLYAEPERCTAVDHARAAWTTQSEVQELLPARQLCVDVPADNSYAVSAFRQDADAFGERGAEIMDAAFIAETGASLNTVQGGDSVRFRVRVRAHRPIAWPAIGFMLKDRLGQYLFTEGTDAPLRRYSLSLTMGDEVDVIFSFRMPILSRGTYTMNVAIAEGLGDDHIQQHWVHDALRLEALSSRLVHGMAGVLELTITMQWLEKTAGGVHQ